MPYFQKKNLRGPIELTIKIYFKFFNSFEINLFYKKISNDVLNKNFKHKNSDAIDLNALVEHKEGV